MRASVRIAVVSVWFTSNVLPTISRHVWSDDILCDHSTPPLPHRYPTLRLSLEKSKCRMDSFSLMPTADVHRYHGSISRDDTALLLGKADGNYLVRQGLSQPDSYSLSFV